MGVYQTVGRATYCNLLYPLNAIIVPYISCTVLANIFGIEAIWFLYTLAEIVTLIFMYVYASIKKKAPAKKPS